MKKALIGYTGFVGKNLRDQENFEGLFNSQNIRDLLKEEWDLVICAGVYAQKWWANLYPKEDWDSIEKLLDVLKQVKTKKLVLISTVDVYDSPNGLDEKSPLEIIHLHAYGRNRLALEMILKSVFPNLSIVRLPALFGNYLKKNFLFDLYHPMPRAIQQVLWLKLLEKLDPEEQKKIKESYTFKDNIYYWNETISWDQEQEIAQFFAPKTQFYSLKFTDSRSLFQWYPLSCLFSDIQKYSLQEGYSLVNFVSYPLNGEELLKELLGIKWMNHIVDKNPIIYDLRTTLIGKDKYLYSKKEILNFLAQYIEHQGRTQCIVKNLI